MTADIYDKLIPALIKAQEEIRPIQPNAENPFLHSKYADLGAHVDGIMPILRKNGLTITQLVFGTDGQVGVETILAHVSGQNVTSKIAMPIIDEKGKTGAQVAGSIISYLRRYALAAIVGAYSGDDDDAAATGKKPVQTRPNLSKPVQQQYSQEQIAAVLQHTQAGTQENALLFLRKGKVPVGSTIQQIESFCQL